MTRGAAITSAQKMREWRQNNPDKAKAAYDRDNAKRKDYQKERYQKLKSDYKEKNLLRYYNITLNEYEQILHRQNYLCEICDIPLGSLTLKNIHLDHCHKTNKIRGVLCNRCNMALGLFSDNTDSLRKAANYLEKYR